MDQRTYNTMSMGRSVDLLTKDEDDSFCGRRTKVEQMLIVICSILAVLSISLIIAVVVISNKEKETPGESTEETPVTTPPSPVDECTTAVCKSAADKLNASIDKDVDPCEDFYSYVCSGWKKNNPIPATMGSFSTFSILQDDIIKELKTVLPNTTFENGDVRAKAKTFYESCIDNGTRENNGVEGLKNITKNLGGWPLLGDELNNYSWLDTLVYTINELSVSPIITVFVAADAKNTTRYLIHLDQTGLGLGRNELLYNGSDETIAAIISAYKNFIKKSAKLLNSAKNDSQLEAEIEEMVKFEKELAMYTRSNEERRDPTTMYDNYTIKGLQQVIKEIDLLSFLDKVMKNITEVTGDTEIVVVEFDYLYQLSKLLGKKTIKDETIANYIGWHVVMSYASSFTQEFRDAVIEFNKVLTGIEEARPLDESCIITTNDNFGFAVGNVYVNNNFDIETKTEIENMIAELKLAFSELLKTNTWMNEKSKEEAENKLKEIIPMVAFPPWVNDTEELNDFYKELGDMNEGDFFANVLSLSKFSIQKQLNKINEPHNRSLEWASTPAVVNAFYSPEANTITFPAGILKFPFYQFGLPPAMNYAGVGTVIGHEITHGFDDEGSQFDAEGNMKNWWPDEVRKKFKNEAQCFVEQYGNYTEPITGMKLNGENTLGENIADNGGIRESFKAYNAVASKSIYKMRLPGLDLTPDQLFFISYGYLWCSNERKEFLQQLIQYNSHSPSRFRIQGPLSNNEEFAKAFNCPEKSTMNPEHRCLLW